MGEALRLPPPPQKLLEAGRELEECDTSNPDCYEDTFYQRPKDDTFSVKLNGEPKSGTTWLEFVVDGLMKHGCDSTATGCTFYNKHRVATMHKGNMSETVNFGGAGSKHL